MAVKKHKLVPHKQKQLDLAALVDYVQLIIEKPGYMPPPHVLIKNCQNVVKCLSRVTGTEQELRKFLQSIEEFLLYAINNVDCDIRNEIVTAIIDKFYSFISDPQSDACPATSVVLVVIDDSDPEAGMSAARWLVHQRQSGPAGAGLRSALSCLFRWLVEWHSTPALGNWILCFIKVLEENELFDILTEVSVDNIANLFTAMNSPVPRRQDVADVISHVLASLRESAEAFDRISPYVGEVLFVLAADSGQWSRQLLQNLVDILTAMMNCNMETLKGVALYIFRDKYAHVIECLERHMASGECALLQLQPWKTRKVEQQPPSSMPPKTPDRKVGLLNLGNTCYMNSVMQALLVARQFSNHVILNMNGVPYWSRMGVLFAKMTHSITTKLNPDEFFSVAKPPFFTWNTQHDSSEFLGYLFELLQSYEHASDINFDYSRPAVLTANRRFIHPHAQPSSHFSEEHQEPNRARRSVSPRPSSSSSASSSSTLKRPPPDGDNYPSNYKRRYRGGNDNFPRRDSFIDSMFGGVLLTRIECVQCRSSSLSRDVYRDLQLAFPEKPVGWQYSVQGLLEYYCSKESLTGDNRYKCRDCNGLRDAEKSVIIETTPKYLILVLKNFKFDAKLQVQTKLMHSVLYNTTVSLPTVRLQQDHNSYALFAAVIHTGTTLDSGHYYTLAKDHDQWFRFNDAVVTVADEMELTKLNRASTPYILFYRRSDVEECSAPPLDSLPPKVQETILSHNKEYVESVRQLCIARP